MGRLCLMTNRRKKLVIIDGKSVFYRGYYAIANLKTSEGRPTGGIYGFTILAFSIIKRLNPDYLAIAWDKSKTNIASRRAIYPDYKANRTPPPEDFIDQTEDLFKLVADFGWPLYELDNYEADDIMATLAHQAGQVGKIETVLVSSDLDLLQAIDNDTCLYAIKKNLQNVDQFNLEEFEKKYNIKISQFRDYKALMGDSSDNIPGVGGVGPKTAATLLNQYSNLEEIYSNLDDIKPQIRAKLERDKKMAFISRDLVTLSKTAPIKLDLAELSFNRIEIEKVVARLKKLEFFSLIRQMPDSMVKNEKIESWAQTRLPKKMPRLIKIFNVDEINDLNWDKPAWIMTHCRGRFGRGPGWLLISFDQETVYGLKLEDVDQIKIELKKPSIKIYGFQTKTAIQSLKRLSFDKIEVIHDIEVADFLLNPNRQKRTLTTIASTEIDYQSELDNLTMVEFIEKAPELMTVSRLIFASQETKLKKNKTLTKLAKTVEFPFINLAAKMETAGIAFDSKKIKELGDELQSEIDLLEKQIQTAVGRQFNLASPKQLSEALFVDLGLPTDGIAKAKQFYRTDIRQLTKLRVDHPNNPVISWVISWRRLSKLKNTYLDPLPEHQDDDSRIRSSWQLTEVITGRLSSRSPNLQNIPRTTTAIGKRIRSAFVAEDGFCLIGADYSQFELRLAAALSGDKNLKEAFSLNQDIHSQTAASLFDCRVDKVTKKQRDQAKTVNFGILYGQSDYTLASQLGISYQQAKEFIEKYFSQRPQLKKYLESVKQKAIDDGFVETLFGRRRSTVEAKSSNNLIKEATLRQAINFPIQGTEADLMKQVMVELDRRLDSDCRQVLQVHDSIIIEAPLSKKAKTVAEVKQTMESICPKLGVDLIVEIKTGKNWGLL